MAFVLRLLGRRIPLATRSFSASTVNAKFSLTEKMDFNEYRKYGLLKDDFWNEEDSGVVEALNRLPQEKKMLRIFRAIRAQQLYLEHNILPESEWSTVEDDHEYLTPYINEIIAEIKERDEWDRTH